jgi:hypothetical protein
MTRNYMTNWRALRKLARTECECGNFPRVDYNRGCARCEAMDRERYKGERTIDVVRRNLARFDLVSTTELANACAVTEAQIRNALGALIESGEVEIVGRSTATEYRIRRAA